MPKRKPVQAFPKLEPQDLLHHPHDKFLKTVLSVRAVAIEWIEFALKPDNFAEIDLEGLQLEKGSYLDEKLKPHFADIVWSGRTWGGNPVRISFIFEHKSWRPDKSVVPQLMRYSAASVESDFRQSRPPSLPVPIVIYHGTEPWTKEKMADLFPDLPLGFQQFVPEVDYIFINVRELSDEQIQGLNLMILSKLLLVLKHGRDEKYVAKNFAAMAIFSRNLPDKDLAYQLFNWTLFYLSAISNLTFRNMDTAPIELPVKERAAFNSFTELLLSTGMEKGMEKGLEKGMEKGLEKSVLNIIKKHPEWTDAQIADLLDVKPDFVEKLRAGLLPN